jgi:hypothetical protein
MSAYEGEPTKDRIAYLEVNIERLRTFISGLANDTAVQARIRNAAKRVLEQKADSK